MDTEDREAGISQSESRHKKGHMTNIYLIDSDEEAIVDFVKDHKELYKINEHFKDKARKECLGEVRQKPQAVHQSMQDLVRIPKDSLQKTQLVQVWLGSQGNNRGRTGFGINLTHQMQGTPQIFSL